MRIGELELEGKLAEAHEEVLVLPRGTSRIVFTARALADLDGFTAECTPPKAKKYWDKSKGWQFDTSDERYTKRLQTYAQRRLGYMVIHSLVDVEWDTVDVDDPGTWPNWEKDLKANGFNQNECNRILGLVYSVNCLDDQKIKEGIQDFLAGQTLAEIQNQNENQSESESQNSETENSTSGEPAS